MQPAIKGRIHYDEKVIHVKKKLCYDLNAIDHKTKYVLAHLFVAKRTKPACVKFLKQIKTTCYKQILQRYHDEKHKPIGKRKLIIFVSDKFGNYKSSFNKLFYRVAKLEFGVPITLKKHGLKHNNNHIERYNQDIKDRIKTMRHLGSFEDAKTFLNLKTIIHNFINPHMQLKGKTPAEKADIHLPLKRNKLLNLIKYARENHITRR
ncbi:MAG: DDE-type integrase/transposase/recombinase [Nanoarchaeota archaeon]|nr:DDE-type integrase/transposase/recombinase [Nanoarchaeota archaeon]MBU1974767.1 DDE-type integrase/transposase/recombinase [Nanoarchaeota archaeon]